MICSLCPRNCRIDRHFARGYCKMPDEIYLARASLHYWEEPCISGQEGSGTVFFSGCSLGCIYCQNNDIALEGFGKEVSVQRLSEIFLELQEKKANNINLVTATHYADKLPEAVGRARKNGLSIPVVYNSGGYETPETIEMLKDTVDIYMPDFKYWQSEVSEKYSNEPRYPEVAKNAINAMVSQKPRFKFDERGMLKSGVIVRHLLLPGHLSDAKQIANYLYKKYGNNIYISLMSQYTPMKSFDNHPELNRKVRKKEYEALLDYVVELGAENVFIQEGDAADESFIPPFTLEGI